LHMLRRYGSSKLESTIRARRQLLSKPTCRPKIVRNHLARPCRQRRGKVPLTRPRIHIKIKLRALVQVAHRHLMGLPEKPFREKMSQSFKV
jgi:hypothetical protein